uniref:Photosystem II protein z n=3 Tax=Nitraria TaxID=43874 RepID=A0A6B9QFI3_9ROSI|nr:photosystem II protein z [Nitraria roborowskii]QHE65660.1 photosystem II protein z [Nitraria sibirica]QHE65740.1 photosystem II protein z [Nitraria tangutorum]
MRELRIPTRKTNPIHNDVPENTTFLLLDQPSGEANTTGTLISKIDEVAINAKTANWKAIVMFLILQATKKKRTIPFDPSISQKIGIKCIIEGFYHESIDSI